MAVRRLRVFIYGASSNGGPDKLTGSPGNSYNFVYVKGAADGSPGGETSSATPSERSPMQFVTSTLNLSFNLFLSL
jgi:hypothetical protein